MPSASDMPCGARRDLYHIALERSDNISYEQSEYIAFVSKHIANRKRDNISATNRFVISFCRYKGLGLAHFVFDRSNAMLALSEIFEFSDKNITLFQLCSFIIAVVASLKYPML